MKNVCLILLMLCVKWRTHLGQFNCLHIFEVARIQTIQNGIELITMPTQIRLRIFAYFNEAIHQLDHILDLHRWLAIHVYVFFLNYLFL